MRIIDTVVSIPFAEVTEHTCIPPRPTVKSQTIRLPFVVVVMDWERRLTMIGKTSLWMSTIKCVITNIYTQKNHYLKVMALKFFWWKYYKYSTSWQFDVVLMHAITPSHELAGILCYHVLSNSKRVLTMWINKVRDLFLYFSICVLLMNR